MKQEGYILLIAAVLFGIVGLVIYMFGAPRPLDHPAPAPIPSEKDIIAHGLKGDASSLVLSVITFYGIDSHNATSGDELILPDSKAIRFTRRGQVVNGLEEYCQEIECMSKDSLERDLKLRIVCREEKSTGKQHNMGSTTAYVPCSRIDALWMDGVEVWKRERVKK